MYPPRIPARFVGDENRYRALLPPCSLCHGHAYTALRVTTAARKVGPARGNAGKGRKKGVPNKATASVKAALIEAFDNRGGVPALLRWANDEPTEFYKLWGRLAPTEITGEGGNALVIRVVRE